MTDPSRRDGPLVSLSRREVLAAAGTAAVVGLAGCLGGRDPVVVQTSLALVDSDQREPLVEGERDELEPDEYVWWEFTLNVEVDVTYEFEVVEGDEVNAFVVEADEFEAVGEPDQAFRAVPGTVAVDATGGTRTATMEAGDYRRVVANADITPENA